MEEKYKGFVEGWKYALNEVKAEVYELLYDETADRFVNSLDKEEFDDAIARLKERWE